MGLRYKGSDYYSMPRCFDEEGNRSDHDDCRNVSLKVKFNEYVDETRLFGMKRLNLHSMSYDKSKLREMLAYELFRDTVLPISGTADICCAFSLRPADTTKEYSEWVTITLGFGKKIDCSGMTGLQISLRSDITRQVNISLSSDVYTRHDIVDGAGYCWVVPSGPKARRYTLDIGDLDYPEWVTHNRPELLDSVLAELSGIGLNPNPFYGGDGELQTIPDSGFLKIDNVRFIRAPE